MNRLLRCSIASSLLFTAVAAPKREWKVGTLVQAARTREPAAAFARGSGTPAVGPYGRSHTTATAMTVYRELQAFTIQGDGYSYQVERPVNPKHPPNVTVHGPLKYAIEKGKFYILDEDGKEWEMTVLEKALVPAPPAADPKNP